MKTQILSHNPPQSTNNLRLPWAIAVIATTGTLLGAACGGDQAKAPPATKADPKTDAKADAKTDVKADAKAEPQEKAACQDPPTEINVAPCLPTDVAGGAQSASLTNAAIFAWQEFIALNWPAVGQDGSPGTRGQWDGSAGLEAVNGHTGTLPTWTTFRHKVEVFPGAGQPPAGVTPGSYDDRPQYIYNPNLESSSPGFPGVGGNGQVPVCPDGDPQGLGSTEGAAFINADEATQIGQDSMFAGVVEQSSLGANGNDPETASQILFLVKANRTYFDYITADDHGPTPWWQGAPASVQDATKAYLAANTADPPPGSADLISFPNGTILTKSAWRRSIPSELDDGRHLVRPLRWYRSQQTGTSPVCYVLDYYTLVALHIIQKTPSAPHFIYATFEHADNLLTSDGRPIEDENGAVIVAGQLAQDPAIESVNATATTGQQLTPKQAGCAPGSSLYYVNNASHDGVPQGKVCIRGRIHPIPQEIIAVNRTAHAALSAYASSRCRGDGANCAFDSECCSGSCMEGPYDAPYGNCSGDGTPPLSVWSYYKLVNVQARPIDKPAGATYQGSDPATYHLANIMLETNYPLQVFSGGFAGGDDPDGTITDYVDGKPYHNVAASGSQYDMGGCMGCHGVAQHEGGGFSFAFDGIRKGFSNRPDVPSGPGNANFLTYDARWTKQ